MNIGSSPNTNGKVTQMLLMLHSSIFLQHSFLREWTITPPPSHEEISLQNIFYNKDFYVRWGKLKHYWSTGWYSPSFFTKIFIMLSVQSCLTPPEKFLGVRASPIGLEEKQKSWRGGSIVSMRGFLREIRWYDAAAT